MLGSSPRLALVRRASPVRRWVAEPLERRALLCGLHPSHLIDAPTFNASLERSASGDAGGSASGDAVSIVWANRGTTGDRFAETFGTAAAAARAVVDQVLADWGRAITSFNRADGTTTLQVNIAMDGAGTGFGATGAPASANQPADGKPRTGSMTIGRGNDTNGDAKGDGGGWFVDPTPGESSEFLGNVINAFSGNRTSGGAFDLYTVVSLELTHVLGFISGTGWTYKFGTTNLITTTTTADTAEAGASNTGSRGYYARFDGPTIKHLLTTNNNGSGGTNWGTPIHTAGGAGTLTANGVTYRGNEDSGNAGYDSARYLPNEVVLRILADTYGYAIADPATLPTFHAVLDASTGLLTVRGGSNLNSADVIDVGQVGTKLLVSVNVGNDTPGSGALPGAGDLPAYVAEFEMSAVTSVSVLAGDGNDTVSVDGVEHVTVRGGAGNDTIRLRRSLSGMTISLQGDEDNDQIQLGENRAGQPNTMNDLRALNVTCGGGTGNDFLHLEDAGQTLITTYAFDKYAFTNAGRQIASVDASVDNVRLYNGGAASQTYVYGTRIPTTVYGGDGADAFYVGDAANTIGDVGSPVELRGEGGTADSIEVREMGFADPGDYTVTSNTLRRNTPTPSGLITFNQIDNFWFRGSGATDTVHITSTGSDVAYKFSGGANSDRYRIRDNAGNRTLGGIDGPITIDGEGGSGDEVGFFDQDETSPRSYVLNNNTLAVSGMASVTTTNVEALWVYGGEGGDTFDVTPSATVEYGVEGNGGADTLTLRTAGTTSPTQVSAGSTAGRWTFGNREDVVYAEIENPGGGGTTNTPPTIGAFNVSPNSVTVGASVTLTATANDSNGTVASVAYYRETNGVGGLQVGGDALLGSSTAGGNWSVGVGTGGWPIGAGTLYAVATDNAAAASAPATATLTVNAAANAAPVIGNFGAAPNAVTVGASVTLIAGSVVDPDGAVASVAFYRESNGVPGLQVGGDAPVGTVTSVNTLFQTATSTAGLSPGTYTYYAQATDNAGATSAALSTGVTVNPQPTGPKVIYAGALTTMRPFQFVVLFDADVGASLGTGDLAVVNLATGVRYPLDRFTWDGASLGASFYMDGVPPDGNYRLTVLANGVSAGGVPLQADYVTSFYLLTGDANFDRVVNFDDLLILARNYGQSGRTQTGGNFDRSADGRVTFDDLLLLARNYNRTLAPPAATAALWVELTPTRRTRGSIAGDVVG